jgi:outer membrane protein OmpA-like peptidoglycan-associated protein
LPKTCIKFAVVLSTYRTCTRLHEGAVDGGNRSSRTRQCNAGRADEVGKRYVNPQVGYLWADDDRSVDDDYYFLRAARKFNSATLTAESRPLLNAVAADLKKRPQLKVELQGHTDNVGLDAYNRNCRSDSPTPCANT